MAETNEIEPIWEKGWEGHELAQLLRMARLPFEQKLEWLEEADRVVRHLQLSRSQLLGWKEQEQRQARID
jgi:hypothetical protein